MGSDFTYTPTAGTIIGVMAALTFLTGLVNSLSTYWMEKMTKTYVIFHVLVLISCAIALLVKATPKHDSHYVFTDVNSTSGWSPVGFSFLFGFLSVSWTMTDYDATAHITEESVCSSTHHISTCRTNVFVGCQTQRSKRHGLSRSPWLSLTSPAGSLPLSCAT